MHQKFHMINFVELTETFYLMPYILVLVHHIKEAINLCQQVSGLTEYNKLSCRLFSNMLSCLLPPKVVYVFGHDQCKANPYLKQFASYIVFYKK